MNKSGRLVSIDLIKSIACIMVILLHSSSPFFFENNTVVSGSLGSQIIYYLGTGAVPLFFMTNGFFLINRKVMDFKYVRGKIISILIPVILWNGIIYLIYLIIKGENVGYLKLTFGSLIQKGFFFQFWFLGSLILLYLLVPVLNKLIKKSFKGYVLLLVVFVLVCFGLDVINHFIFHSPIQMHVIQTFRLWTWVSYYCLGGLIGNIYLNNKEDLHHFKWFSVLILTVVMVIFSIKNEKWINNIYAEYNYDNLLIMLWIVSIFLFVLDVDFKNKKIQKIIEVISMNSMGIYIIHVFFLKIIQHLIDSNGLGMNIFTVMIVFLCSLVTTIIISRIPYVKYLVRI